MIHGQLIMAASALCYVQLAGLLLFDAWIPPAWSLVAFLGTLGIYLLDSVRSADREDAISQPVRAALFRKHRGLAVCAGLLSLLIGGGALLAVRPAPGSWCLVVLMGVLGMAYLLPVLPASDRWHTLKDLSLVKPVMISLAWLLGAFVVAWDAAPPTSTAPWGCSLVFATSTGSILLLDSLWLDRRDRIADLEFDHPTISSGLGDRGFLIIRLVLWILPCWILLLDSGFLIPLAGLMAGSLVLVLIEPDRLASEAAQVVAASLWRFTALLTVVLWLA